MTRTATLTQLRVRGGCGPGALPSRHLLVAVQDVQGWERARGDRDEDRSESLMVTKNNGWPFILLCFECLILINLSIGSAMSSVIFF